MAQKEAPAFAKAYLSHQPDIVSLNVEGYRSWRWNQLRLASGRRARELLKAGGACLVDSMTVPFLVCYVIPRHGFARIKCLSIHGGSVIERDLVVIESDFLSGAIVRIAAGGPTFHKAAIELVLQIAERFAIGPASSHLDKMDLGDVARISIDGELGQRRGCPIHALANRAFLQFTDANVNVGGAAFLAAFLHLALDAEAKAVGNKPIAALAVRLSVAFDCAVALHTWDLDQNSHRLTLSFSFESYAASAGVGADADCGILARRTAHSRVAGARKSTTHPSVAIPQSDVGRI
jgi:hypothetical protein